jgi:Bifunctional DNA primase/polymerase, N-terminal
VSAMLDAAFGLAAVGWEVFPCIPKGTFAKAPYKDPALGLEHGHLHATSDPNLIERWWRRWPNAMIGARVPSTMLVIDIDPRKGGDLAGLIKLVGQLPPTLTVWSGRNDGGQHLYFRRPTDLQTTSTRLPKGIDLKKNGYCIVPPSIHPATSQPYRWEMHEPAILPYRLRELLAPLPSRHVRVVGVNRQLKRASSTLDVAFHSHPIGRVESRPRRLRGMTGVDRQLIEPLSLLGLPGCIQQNAKVAHCFRRVVGVT